MNWRVHRGYYSLKRKHGTLVMYEPLSMEDIQYMMDLEHEEPQKLLGILLGHKI